MSLPRFLAIFSRRPAVAAEPLARRNRIRRERQPLVSERLEPRAMLSATIVEVSSTVAPGTAVGIGGTIPFQVIYDEPVSVLATPVAYVNVTKAGGVQAIAQFQGASGGGRILNFSYSVVAGDVAPQFNVLETVPFLVGGTITTVSDGLAADRIVVPADPTIADLQPGLRVDGVAPATPTVSPTVYVNPTVWQSGAWATLHPGYFAITGTAGSGPLAADEVLTVTVNGATYRATAASSTGPGNFFVDADGEWEILIRSVGGEPATIPFSGAVAPWSTTDGDTYNVVATLADAAGNMSTDTTTAEVVIDTIAPTVSAVNSTSLGNPGTPPGAYPVGATLNLYVVYNEPMRVVGTPLLQVNVLPGPAVATFVSVVNGNELHFQYVVQPGDSAPAGGFNIADATSLLLNGGFIEDLAANSAGLALPTATAPPPAASNNVAGIVIDTVAPVINLAGGVTAPNPNGTYVAADGANAASPAITIEVNFSEPVFVTGTPQLALNSFAGRVATWSGGNGSTTLSFTYTVQAGDDSPDLDYTSISALSLNGGQIRDSAGNNAVLTLPAPGTPGSLGDNKAIVVAAKPQVLQVSSPTPPGTYSAGDTVRIRVMFDKPVTAASGPSPFLLLGTSPAASVALWSSYIDGSGNTTTTPTNISEFTYTVKPGDTTSGAPLNYASPTALNAGAGLNLVWTGAAIPNLLAANLTLPPLVDPDNVLPNAGIIISPDSTTPASPMVGLTADTVNALGNYATDGITSNPTVAVSGLETKFGTTWEYRYQYTGGASSGWLAGGPISTTGTGSFTLATTATPGGTVYAAGSIEVRQTDWSGNVSPVATNAAAWTIDVNQPTAPSGATIAETGPAGSGITNNPLVTVTGLEAGALLQYNTTYNSNTNAVTGAWVSVPGTGVSGYAGGAATFILPVGVYDPATGSGVVVRQQDVAGTPSPTPPWTQLTSAGGGTTVVVTLDTTIAPPTIGLTADTTPGFPPYSGVPYTTDGVTSNGQITVSGLEVQDLAATPPVAGIAFWEYRVNGGAWVLGGTAAPSGTFTLPAGTYAPGTVEVRETDLAGNVATVSNSSSWTIEQTAPVITGISAPAGTYLPGSVITITVTMSEPVYVSAATATLGLNTGGVATLVQPVVPSNTLQFTYTVPQGASTSTGTLAITGIALNGTTIADLAGNQFIAALPAAPPIVLPGVVFDQTAPQITGITANAGTYVAGQTVVLSVNFSEPVYLTGTTATLSLNSAPGRVATMTVPVTPGATSVTFTYLVQVGDSTPLLEVTAFNLNGTVITDLAGNVGPGTLPVTPLTVVGPVVIDAGIKASSPQLGSEPFGPAYAGPLTRIPITFSTPVRNFRLASIRLYWNNRSVSLRGARLIGSRANYVLILPRSATNLRGPYRLEINGPRTAITSLVGNIPMTGISNLYWQRV